MIDTIISIIGSTLGVSAPIIYGSLGETLSQRAGVLNLGLEGIMLAGAIVGYTTAVNTNNLVLAILATLIVGAALGLVFGFMTITLQANQSVCGLAMVMFGTGLSGFLGKRVYSMAAFDTFVKVAIPGLSDIPVLGPIFFNQNYMVYALYILVPLATLFISKTRPGLKLRALGENPAALDAAGLNVFGMRYFYTILGAAIVALGGAYVTLAYTPSWVDGITAGKGWIAAALVIFAGWNPTKAALGALLFGGVEVIGLRLQSAGVPVPSYFLSMLPYISTIIVLVLSTGNFIKKRTQAPASLGRYYDREAR